ncbi:hypothetical protein [Falsiroseomonas sp. HW251]|uniref:hypothetical protein n=1 Tax=Falsiroseomonas sp. HW251 TaxID=3390998 RepID=UPI003D321CC9
MKRLWLYCFDITPNILCPAFLLIGAGRQRDFALANAETHNRMKIMTEDTGALGAPARADQLDIIFACEDLRAVLLQLEQVLRLHEAEAQRALSAGAGMTTREVAASWTSASELLAHTVVALRAAEVRMTAQFEAVLQQLRAVASRSIEF